MGVTKSDITKGKLFRLTSRIGNSKKFVKGTIIKITNMSFVYNCYIGSGSYTNLNGEKNNSWDSDLYYTELEPVSEKEIVEMSKPAEVLIVEVGTINTFHTSSKLLDKLLQEKLTAKPSAKFAVYNLSGVAQAEPVPIKFIMAESLD